MASNFLQAKYRGNTVYTLILKGQHALKAPEAYVSPFTRAPEYSEIVPTPLALQNLLKWAQENNLSLKLDYRTKQWLEREYERRAVFEKPRDVRAYFRFDDLYEHQRQALSFALANISYLGGHLRLLLADDPRLGKSPQAMAIASLVRTNTGGKGPILILCPKALIAQWQQYVADWYEHEVDVLIPQGTTSERGEQIITAVKEAKKQLVVITNWELLHWSDALHEVKWWMLIGDEAHKLKSRKSKISMKTASLSATHIMLLSATFIENLPSDWFSPLSIIHPVLFSSYWRFVGHFVNFEYDWGAKADVPVGPKNVHLLKDIVAPYVIQRRSDEVADMPEKVYETYRADLADWHRKFYDDVRDSVIIELQDGDAISVTHALTKLIRLRQAAIHPGLIDPALWDKGPETGKLEVLKEIVNNVVPEDDQILVYSSFVNGARAAAWAIGQDDCVIYAGDDADEQQLTAFQRGKKRVMCATPGKGGVGLNLYNANWVFFLDIPWSTIELRQAEERVRAVGKRGPVYICHLVAKDTIDSQVWRLVQRKTDNLSQAEIVRRVVAEYKK